MSINITRGVSFPLETLRENGFIPFIRGEYIYFCYLLTIYVMTNIPQDLDYYPDMRTESELKIRLSNSISFKENICYNVGPFTNHIYGFLESIVK